MSHEERIPSESLERLRADLHANDRVFLRMVWRRRQLVRRIAALKEAMGMPRRDEAREEQARRELRDWNTNVGGYVEDSTVVTLYDTLVDVCQAELDAADRADRD